MDMDMNMNMNMNTNMNMDHSVSDMDITTSVHGPSMTVTGPSNSLMSVHPFKKEMDASSSGSHRNNTSDIDHSDELMSKLMVVSSTAPKKLVRRLEDTSRTFINITNDDDIVENSNIVDKNNEPNTNTSVHLHEDVLQQLEKYYTITKEVLAVIKKFQTSAKKPVNRVSKQKNGEPSSTTADVTGNKPRKQSKYNEFMSMHIKDVKAFNPAMTHKEAFKACAGYWNYQKSHEGASLSEFFAFHDNELQN
jgi:hypothetical protein